MSGLQGGRDYDPEPLSGMPNMVGAKVLENTNINDLLVFFRKLLAQRAKV